MPAHQLLASLYRGGRMESQHFGSVAVVDANGHLIASVGDAYHSVYLRSCAKPFQASVVVSSGVKDRFQFTDKELAVIAASHAAGDEHLEAVKSILTKIGLTENDLQCGAHAPHLDSRLHNNCSGKHAGMLAVAVDMGLSTSDYLDIQHPVQQSIRAALADAAGISDSDMGWAVDGCSAPTFFMPLVGLARAFARLGTPVSGPNSPQSSIPTVSSLVGKGKTWSRSEAFSFVAQAMMQNPKMVAGPGRLDTEVMSAWPGRIVLKGGAEGVQAASVGGLGIAIKILDGNGRRAAGPVLLDVLRQLQLIEKVELQKMEKFRVPQELNARGIAVGEVKPEFRLDSHS